MPAPAPTLRHSIHGQWSSRLAFVLAASGSAIGLGNVWRFPYVAGEHGGAAFVYAYLACVVLIGLPVMMAEILIGRRGRRNPVTATRLLSEEEAGHRGWGLIGKLGILTGLTILSYYALVAGWSLIYVGEALRGALPGGADAAAARFSAVQRDPWLSMLGHSLFLGASAWVVARGVAGGLERTVKLVMPLLVALLLALTAYAMLAGDLGAGLRFLFVPDWSALDGDLLLAALGQAFFALSVGMGALMAYAAYLPRGSSIGQTSVTIVVANTSVSLLVGLLVFPLAFAHGVEPAAGEGLVFNALPLAFAQMPGGMLFGAAFFLLLSAAALTSAIALLEPAVAWLAEARGMARQRAAWLVAGSVWAGGVLIALSFGPLAGLVPGDTTLYEGIAYLTSDIMLPLGALAMAVFTGWVMCKGSTVDELEVGIGSRYSAWRFAARVIVPLAVLGTFWRALGG
jgi:NSS family neurotransmitter:Na+ symporter